MTLPDDLATVVVTGGFLDPAGNPLSGRVTFTPTADLTDPTGEVIVPQATRAYQLSRGRFTSDPLVATDNETITPTGWAYTVCVSLQGLDPLSYEILLPQDSTPVDLSALTPVTAQPAVSAYLTLAGGTLSGTLTLNGGLRIPSGAASGDVLTSDSSGNAAWGAITAPELPAATSSAQGAVELNTDLGGTATAPHVVATHLASALPIAQGGTAATSASAAITALTGTQASGTYLRSNGTSAALSAIQAGDVPTLNQNTTGTAAGLSSTLAIGSGGTGSATRNFSGLLTQTATKTSAYTASPGDFVCVDTTSGAVTVTLPNAPADLTVVAVKMTASAATPNAVTIACAGSDVINKTGGGTTLSLSLVEQSAILQYQHSTGIWLKQTGDVPLSQLDTRYANVFSPLAYSAAGNALQVTDGAMTASSATLTCSTSNEFTSALVNVGQTVVVQGAGAAGADLVTTISGFTSTSVVTLAAAASTTVTGATVTFGTDDTTAMQNCIIAAHTVNGVVDLGYRTYLTTSPLSIVSGIVIRGVGPTGGAITNASTSLFSITGSKSNWAILDCTLTASAGHVFDCSASGTTVSSARILNVTITQTNSSYGIWYQPDGNYLNMLVGDGCYITAPAACTTAPWYIVSGSGGIASANASTWRQMTVINSLNQAVPFFYIESVSTHTTSFSFNSDLVFRDITAEECSGGIFQGMSVANVTIDGVSGYDASYYGHVFSIGTSSTGGQASRNIIVRNSGRRDGGLSTGILDFYASSDTINIILENVGPADTVSSAVSYSVPQSATVFPLQTLVPVFYLNSAAGGTNSASVTTGNSGGSSGKAWSAVNGTVAYDNSVTLSGASPLAYKLTGSSSAANVTWSLATSGVTAPPTVYLRTYFQFTGSPFEADVLVSDSLNYRVTFDYPTSGVFNLRAAPGSFTGGLFAPSAGTWYRVEMRIALSSGTAMARIYNLDGVMLDSISASGGISAITGAYYGCISAYTGTMWVAYPAYSNQDWIGP